MKRCFYNNGKLDNEFNSYHENGQLKECGFYKNNKLNKEFKPYHKNCQIKYHSYHREDCRL